MLITIAQLSDYLGAGEDSREIVNGCRDGAIAYLQSATGISFTDESKNARLANEAIKALVWQSFHALRGGGGDAEFIRQHITAVIKQLQYSGGGTNV